MHSRVEHSMDVDKMDNGKIVIFGGGVRSKLEIRLSGAWVSAVEPVKKTTALPNMDYLY